MYVLTHMFSQHDQSRPLYISSGWVGITMVCYDKVDYHVLNSNRFVRDLFLGPFLGPQSYNLRIFSRIMLEKCLKWQRNNQHDNISIRSIIIGRCVAGFRMAYSAGILTDLSGSACSTVGMSTPEMAVYRMESHTPTRLTMTGVASRGRMCDGIPCQKCNRKLCT